MIKFIDKVKNIILQVDKLSLRERVLVLLSTVFITYFSWRGLVFDHLSNSKQQIAGNALKLQKQIFNLQGQISEVSSSLNLDPILRLQEKVDVIQEENNALEKKLSSMTEGLISPKDMTSLLQILLDKHKNLTLVSLENTKASAVFDATAENSLLKDAKLFQVYKHGIEFVVSGTFFQLKDFLEEAEQVPWKILWEELDYSVTKYPIATIKIVIKTLSLDYNLLGTP